jgi:diaminopimelate decarboxylase
MNTNDSIPTPYFLYDLDLLENTLSAASCHANRHGYTIHYAIKANHQPTVVKRMIHHGMGIDCVSGNEVAAALELGFPSNAIVFAGVAKSDEEINLAIDHDIFCLNCESVEELSVIDQIAAGRGAVVRVALRVNPDVDAETHRHITTGLDENKFGIHLQRLQEALDFCYASENLEFMGLHFHIGSQILAAKPYIELCKRVNHIWKEFNMAHYGAKILNLGGGLGIDYENPAENPVPDFESFFRIFESNLNIPSNIHIHFELGRSLVGQSASLITKVLYVKKGVNKQFVIADAGMTELLRPALYQAVHRIDNLSSELPAEQYDVVGPACESSDTFATGISLPQVKRGDLLAIRSCGAYGQSMSLHYNLRNQARSFFTSNGIICPEESPSELFQAQVV